MGLRTTIRRRIAARLAGRLSRFGSGTSVPATLNAFRQYLLSGIGSTYDDSGYLRDSGANKGTYRGPRGAHVGQLNGANLYGSLDSRITTGSPDTLTAMCWVNTTYTGTTGFISEYDAGASSRSWLLGMNSSNPGKLVVLISQDGGNVNFKNYQSSTSINDGAWHLVAFTFGGGVLRVFIDDVEDTTIKVTDGTVTSLFNSSIPMTIGQTFVSGTPSNFYPGKLSDCRVYNVAKTTEQIAAIYNDGKSDLDNPDTDGLLGGWAIEEESGTTLYDWTGNGKHLTLAGTTTGFRVTDTGKKWSLVDSQGYTTRMLFDGVNDYVEVTGMTASTDYFGACTISAKVLVTSIGSDQVIWTLGAGGYRLFIDATGVWAVGTTNTAATVSLGWHEVSVSYNSSGDSLSITDNGVVVWTGNIPGSSPGTSFTLGARITGGTPGLFLKGLIWDFAITGSAVKNFAFDGTGNTDADWADQIGANDGTVNGSPDNTYIPAATATLDALGGTLQYTGLAHYRGRSYTNTLTGNGTDVYVDCGQPLIPATADWSIRLRYFHTTNVATQRVVFAQTETTGPVGRIALVVNQAGGVITAGRIELFVNNTTNFFATPAASLVENTWHDLVASRVGNLFSLTVTPEGGMPSTGTCTTAVTLYAGRNTWLFANTSSTYLYSNGSIANFEITTGGVTKTIVPEGTGTRLWLIGSDGSAVELPTAIQGTITSVHGTAALATEDWFMRYGGSVRTSFDGVDDYINVPVANFRSSDSSGKLTFRHVDHGNVVTTLLVASSDKATSNNFFVVGKLLTGEYYVQTVISGASSLVKTASVFAGQTERLLEVSSSGSAWSVSVDGEVQSLVVVDNANNGNWFADVSGRDNFTVGVLDRLVGLSSPHRGVIHDVKIYDPTDTLVNHWRGYGVNDWSDQVGSNNGTVVGASTVYIPNKTDGTSVISGLTPTSTGGELLEGRKIDMRGGVDSAFAQRVNLESEYTYGDDRLLVDPIYTKDKTIGTGVEYEFKADDDIILDSYAIGGTITEADGYRIHTITSSDDFIVSGETLNIECVLVGGGGGASTAFTNGASGGAGGGGVLVASTTVTPGIYPVIIGTGGTGAAAVSNALGTDGAGTSAFGLSAVGGGRSGNGDSAPNGNGISGGCGGGRGYRGTSPGSGTTDQGFEGGAGFNGAIGTRAGGGGGGAGSVGQNAGSNAGGNGGNGKTTWAGTFGGGGGGASDSGTLGTGGTGGGGSANREATAGVNGTANTGGGGGGAEAGGGGNGGSGIVIIRYPI